MKLTARQYAEALMAMTAEKSGKALESAVKTFVADLEDRHELSRWREIVRAFDNAWARKYGASQVSLTTAYEPTKKVLEELEKAYPHASINHIVDPSLVGGAVIQVDDRRFDGSIADQLNRIFQS